MPRKGADIVIETLKEEGVEVVFGHPGGAIMEVYDALYRDGSIRHILVRHEQGAGHMAEGYAKATGKVGVAMSTSGPGATNLVTAIADAYMDSVPVVFITGQVPTHLIGNDAFQEVDIVGITRPITKHNFLVKRIEDLPLIIRQAFYIAKTGRPGPVLVDIPKDITQKLSDVKIPTIEEVKESLPGYKPHLEGNLQQIYEATKGQAIIATGVGQHQMWSAMFYKYSFPRQFINSGGLGTMGFGLPAGIGAKIGRPDREVFVIDGDGSFMMTMQELITAVQYRVPVKIAIINNGYLGMVRQWQELFYEKRYSEVDLSIQPDFVKLAEACGAVGFRAEKPSEVREIIEEALKIDDRPVLMDFHVDREENVFPMVPAGKSYREMILEDGKKSVEAETMYLVG